LFDSWHFQKSKLAKYLEKYASMSQLLISNKFRNFKSCEKHISQYETWTLLPLYKNVTTRNSACVLYPSTL